MADKISVNQKKRFRSRRKSKKASKTHLLSNQANEEAQQRTKWKSRNSLNILEIDKRNAELIKKLNSRVSSVNELMVDKEGLEGIERKKTGEIRDLLKKNLNEYNRNPTHPNFKKLMENVGL